MVCTAGSFPRIWWRRLRRAREVEAAARGRRGRRRDAIRATSILLAAAQGAGWRAPDLAQALGMQVPRGPCPDSAGPQMARRRDRLVG